MTCAWEGIRRDGGEEAGGGQGLRVGHPACRARALLPRTRARCQQHVDTMRQAPPTHSLLSSHQWSAWLAPQVERVTLDLRS